MATLMSEIDCSQHTTREINQAIKRAAADGVPEVRLSHPGARHALAVAVMHPVRIVFEGPVGWYCGGMCDGPDIVVRGNCGWSVGENLMSGSITVEGNGGSSAGATIRGGRIFIAGDTGARTGISMKGGTLVVGGSVGYMSGFMMQRGTMIVCGDAGDGIGDSMYEGTVYVGGTIQALGADCVEAELTADDRAMLEQELAQNDINAGGMDWKKLVAGRKLWNFSKHEYDAWRAAL
ncbi:MAG: methylamine---glutamate N-methyltransferase subunit [Gaiellales bacterium]|nr:methylamine---glutamate N-methyltransferase subunit [Gaiellales bacterium]